MTSNAKILLAEDDANTARHLNKSLLRLGYQITDVARTGEDVLENIADNLPDIILMDISLGGKIDGIDAVQKILSQVDIPVIYVTASSENDIFERAKQTEPYAYLVKPFELCQLQNAIEIALVKHIYISKIKQAEQEIRLLNDELSSINRGLNQEIALRERVEKQLRYKATHDNLTGLPNRVLLFDRMKQAFAFESRHNTLIAIMILDLDNFKNINDTLGHLSGDILLKKVAQELLKCVRQYDTVGRLGGDEFVIVINDANTVQDIITFAEKVQTVFRKPFDILGHETYLTTSIGIAVYPLHGSTIDTLLKKADMAMYVAKNSGRNTFKFSDSMDVDGSSKHPGMRPRRRITQESTLNNFHSTVAESSKKDQLSH
jgi:diguanylate cyclase (GGDEF)-like protein